MNTTTSLKYIASFVTNNVDAVRGEFLNSLSELQKPDYIRMANSMMKVMFRYIDKGIVKEDSRIVNLVISEYDKLGLKQILGDYSELIKFLFDKYFLYTQNTTSRTKSQIIDELKEFHMFAAKMDIPMKETINRCILDYVKFNEIILYDLEFIKVVLGSVETDSDSSDSNLFYHIISDVLDKLWNKIKERK